MAFALTTGKSSNRFDFWIVSAWISGTFSHEIRRGEGPAGIPSVGKDVFKEKRKTLHSFICRAACPAVALLACEWVGKPQSHDGRSNVWCSLWFSLFRGTFVSFYRMCQRLGWFNLLAQSHFWGSGENSLPTIFWRIHQYPWQDLFSYSSYPCFIIIIILNEF